MIAGIGERAAEIEQRRRAREGFFGGAEALGDDVGQVVINSIVLGLDDLREALPARPGGQSLARAGEVCL